MTTMTLGPPPAGCRRRSRRRKSRKIVNYAIDLGITSIDTAPAYKQSEEGIGLALGRRRKEVFLATKVLANTVEEAEKSLAKSFELLKTDYFDLVYYHSVGSRKLEGTMEPGGVFDWLLKQKKAGKFRFLGISGHQKPGRFPQFLETGEVDVLLTVINFVDRHTYNFEEKVLPVARKHNVGIVAMKVFGGARSAGSTPTPTRRRRWTSSTWNRPSATPWAPRRDHGQPGVHNKEQVRKNVEMVRNFKPLTADEQDKLAALGKELAPQWGPHFGPVA